MLNKIENALNGTYTVNGLSLFALIICGIAYASVIDALGYRECSVLKCTILSAIMIISGLYFVSTFFKYNHIKGDQWEDIGGPQNESNIGSMELNQLSLNDK